MSRSRETVRATSGLGCPAGVALVVTMRQPTPGTATGRFREVAAAGQSSGRSSGLSPTCAGGSSSGRQAELLAALRLLALALADQLGALLLAEPLPGLPERDHALVELALEGRVAHQLAHRAVPREHLADDPAYVGVGGLLPDRLEVAAQLLGAHPVATGEGGDGVPLRLAHQRPTPGWS